jgi:hypothetical protein
MKSAAASMSDDSSPPSAASADGPAAETATPSRIGAKAVTTGVASAGGLVAGLRAHRSLIALLAIGFILRILVMVAYPQAFLYSDSIRYLEYSHMWQPDFMRQWGYSLVLMALRQTRSVYVVSGLQHLLGLATAGAMYALLQRRHVPKWLSLIAVAPVILDGFQVTVEHYLLAETFFTTIIVGGLLALLWPRRTTALTAGLAGFLLALTPTFRAVSLPLVAASLIYLLVRRVGWRPVLSFAVCAALPVVGYAAWFNNFYGTYGFTSMQGHFLYGRVAPFADCDRLSLTQAQRRLCPALPIGVREPRNDWYIFNLTSKVHDSDNATREGFFVAVATQQPVDTARAIGADVMRFFVPHGIAPDWVCANEGLLLPANPPQQVEYSWCQPNPRQAFGPEMVPSTMPPATALTRALGAYAHGIQTPRLFLGLSLALVLLGSVWRPRRRVGVPVWDVLLLGGWGFGLLLFAVAGSTFDERYAVPSLAILPVGAALALYRLVLVRRSRLD